ncbi:DUF1642 domain-containing protein [Lacticaseibacillus saniviri]|uniref:DUF1642 domain-containing protein n=1 Tax=Lacticaseibacillus saniviri TaxID=931533 RepID=UPI001EDFDC7F|nr:DUF1642 domain-containing protein [Lacticaseibacillus saniviri]MCG4280893.1 DUF1642 domain-containing protein [Lacticaseibacillus saniviri]
MNKHELILKIKEAFTSLNSDAPALDTAWVMGQVEEYVKSLQPAKEVIPRAWAEYIERRRDIGSKDDEIIYEASIYLEISFDDGSYDRFIKAVVNGYEVEPEKKYLLPIPSAFNDDINAGLHRYASRQTNGLPGDYWDTSEPIFKSEAQDKPNLFITQRQIDSAPDWVKALKPVEVKEDED